MWMDALNEFCDAEALSTAATGLALVGDVINLQQARDIAAGAKPIYLVIQVQTTVLAAGGAATVAFVLASDAQAAIAVDGSATEHFRSAAIAKATLVAGYELVMPLPSEGPVYEQYLGILQDVSTNQLTAGKINAFLTTDPPVYKAYPDGVTD